MSLILQELGIVVAMQQSNPNLVTAEFLKLSGIVPLDWQLATEPIHRDNLSQLLFTNGVRIDTVGAVERVLTNWQTDLSAHCELITDRFLSPSTPTLSVPTVADRDEDNLEPVEIPYAPNLYPILSFS
jgi:hypothetical protein